MALVAIARPLHQKEQEPDLPTKGALGKGFSRVSNRRLLRPLCTIITMFAGGTVVIFLATLCILFSLLLSKDFFLSHTHTNLLCLVSF